MDSGRPFYPQRVRQKLILVICEKVVKLSLDCEVDRVQVVSEGKRSETWVRVKRSMNPKKKEPKGTRT